MTVYFFLYQRFPNFKDEFSANILFAATFIFIYFHFTYFLHIELRWGENCDWTKSIWLAMIGQIPPGGQKLQISTCGCAGRQQQNLKIVSRYVGNSKHFYTQSTPIHSNYFNFRPGKWQWYTTKLIIYQKESESGFAQIAELRFWEIWPTYQVK